MFFRLYVAIINCYYIWCHIVLFTVEERHPDASLHENLPVLAAFINDRTYPTTIGNLIYSFLAVSLNFSLYVLSTI